MNTANTVPVGTHFARALGACGVTHEQWNRDLTSRHRSAVFVRRTVWVWMWTTPIAPGCEITLEEIGVVSGGFDHTTVLHGLRKAGVLKKPCDVKPVGGAA